MLNPSFKFDHHRGCAMGHPREAIQTIPGELAAIAQGAQS